MSRILVAMSGGVDSSVVASLLKEQGHEVIGVTMQVWDYTKNTCAVDEGNGTCCSSLDVDDARAVADQLNIPFYVVNCEEKFKSTVIDPFVKDFMSGRTPIPCINCNTFLKFDHLIQKMEELNCDYLATGHYARVEKNESGKNIILRSHDDFKDQTYFLFTLQPELLNKILFPVGTWQKSDLRAYAESRGLPVAKKRDSTGICFVGKEGYQGFIDREYPNEKRVSGRLIHIKTQEVLGTHTGIHGFTYGQRKGLGVSYSHPLFVVKIDHDSGDVWLGEEDCLYGSQVNIVGMHWIDDVIEGEPLKVKIRYAQKAADAKISFSGRANNPRSAAVIEFANPQRSITPGQAAVVYRGEQLLGGGWIV